jgi:hypothetical protein
MTSMSQMSSNKPKMTSSESLAHSVLQATGLDTQKGPRKIAVYGFEHCKWGVIKTLLSVAKLPDSSGSSQRAFAQVLDYCSKSYIIPNSGPASNMKAFLTSILFENYIKKKKGKNLIPVLFCGDVNNNPYPPTPEKITSKLPGYNELFGHKEIRRILKHFILKEMLLDTPIDGLDTGKALEIANTLVEIAKETFIAVKVIEGQTGGSIVVRTIPFFFQDKSYPLLLEKRRTSSPKTGKKINHWKRQLYTLICDWERSRTNVPPLRSLSSSTSCDDFISLNSLSTSTLDTPSSSYPSRSFSLSSLSSTTLDTPVSSSPSRSFSLSSPFSTSSLSLPSSSYPSRSFSLSSPFSTSSLSSPSSSYPSRSFSLSSPFSTSSLSSPSSSYPSRSFSLSSLSSTTLDTPVSSSPSRSFSISSSSSFILDSPASSNPSGSFSISSPSTSGKESFPTSLSFPSSPNSSPSLISRFSSFMFSSLSSVPKRNISLSLPKTKEGKENRKKSPSFQLTVPTVFENTGS